MTGPEAKEQLERVEKYRALEKLQSQTYKALDAVTKSWANGPCGQGPFTSNTRESRRVESLHIEFTQTRGGAPAVSDDIFNLGIEAWELGRALGAMLRARLETIAAEMEKI